MSLRALPSLWSRPSAVARVLGLRVISTSDGSRSSPLSAEKTQELREWAEAFERRELGKDLVGCEVRYDRAGGPGGQNVNKVNTKATLRVSLAQASPNWISPSLISSLTSSSPYYTQATHSLLLSGSANRTQSANLADCFTKLQAHLLQVAKPLMPNETSQEKKDAIEEMMVRQKERARKEKDVRKKNKDSRRGRGRDE